MPATVFFSWQSDRPQSEGRYFIEKALETAINNLSQDIELQGAVRDPISFDKDTKDEPGFVKIFETILEKIEKATVFVPDFTFVATRPEGQPTPNPNVLIEYGYALKTYGAKGERRIMPVMNAAYGKPTRETMPFDLMEHRNAITYDLLEGADAEIRKAQQKELTKAFERALKTFFASEFYSSSLPKPEPVTYREPKNGRARFRAEGEPIGVSEPNMPAITGIKSSPVFLNEGPAMWLRIGPQTPLTKKWKVTDLRDRIGALTVLPLCELAGSQAYVRAADGCGFYRLVDSDKSPIVAFLFTDGEIWLVNTFYIQYDQRVILLEEARLVRTLEQAANMLKQLGVAGPYRWVLGVEGIANRYLPAQTSFGGQVGPCTVDVVEESGLYNSGGNAAEAIEPFLVDLYDKCGKKR